MSGRNHRTATTKEKRVKNFSTAAAIFFAVLVVLRGGPGTAHADPFVKNGPTGKTAATAQITVQGDPFGSPDLTAISGTLDSLSVGVERATRFDTAADLFQIYLTGDGTFSATTANIETNLFDTCLFLFDANGYGVYYNDNDPNVFGARSTLPAGGPLSLLTPGFYVLAIAPFGLFPQSTAGAIFPDVLSTPGYNAEAVSGPTGPGGARPLVGWTGTTVETGAYTINLTGARFAHVVPEPGTLILVLVAAGPMLAVGSRRRRPSLPANGSRGARIAALVMAVFALGGGGGVLVGAHAAPIAAAPTGTAPATVNTLKSIQRLTSPRPGVEIELSSSRDFPVGDDIVIMRIGARDFSLSRPPADGRLNTLIFFLTPSEWESVKTGERVFVYYGSDDAKNPATRWDFGNLNKSLLK